jgi:hypothetical protein
MARTELTVSRQPRFVQIAQAIVILSAIYSAFRGLWSLARANEQQAVAGFTRAALGAAVIVLYYALYFAFVRIARRRAIQETIPLEVDASTALRRTVEALRTLAPGHDPEVDTERLTASTFADRNWISFGQHVTALVRPDNGGSVVEVTSDPGPQLFDRGKNRANVEVVIRSLAAVDSRRPRDSDETS